MNRRLPVRPTPSSPRLLAAFNPEPIPKHQVIDPRSSSEYIAESMTKEFKYDPDDKTPPKRRMKAVAETVISMMEGDPGPSSTSLGRPEPIARVTVPAAMLEVDQQEAQQKLEQARAQAGLEKAEVLKSEEPLALHELDVTAKLANMEAIITANRVILGTADDSKDAVPDRNTLARRNLLRTDETNLDDDRTEEDDGPAAYFLNSDAQRHFEENKRLTILSEHTEPSSSGRGDDVDGPSAGFWIEQPKLTPLNIVEPGVWVGQSNLRNGLQFDPSRPPSPLKNDVGEAGPSRIAESFFSANVSKPQQQYEEVSPVELNDSHEVDAIDRGQYPTAVIANPGPQHHPLPAPPKPAVVRAGTDSPLYLSPIREVDSSRDLLPERSDASPLAPLQTESEKPPSTAVSSSISSSAAGCVSKWCSIVWKVLAWAIPLTFLAGALYSLATTRTFHEMPPDLFTAVSKTLQSENAGGSGNLTMEWMDRHAVGFNVSAVLNTTLDAGETGSKSWSFLFDWKADEAMLGADAVTASRKVSAMPLPSFGQEFLRSMGFLGLFAAIFWLVRCILSAVSRCWHWREDSNLFWTRTLLRQFDGGRLWADLTLSAVVSAVVWAAASRALLAMSF